MSTVLITGCSTGIGAATAEMLARSGHTVYATMRNPEGAPALGQLARRESLPITVLPMDVDSDEAVRTTINDILAREGSIEVLVNNAGIAPFGAVELLPLDVFRQAMETNYFGVLRCIHAVLPGMRQRGTGCIINISSVAGKLFSPFMSAYSATKAALEAFSEALAGEVQALGVRVAVVEPGVIETPILSKLPTIPVPEEYPMFKRTKAFFAASVDNHVPPTVVADVIREIVETGSTQFRYPVGPDSAPLIGWRASLSDEDWVASAAMDEETWIAGMGQLGLDVRPYLTPTQQPVSA